MKEQVPWRCRVLRWLNLHGVLWIEDAGTPAPHNACKGCGRMWPVRGRTSR